MPSNFTLRAVNTVHRALLRLSFGRLGTEYFGMPALELITIGRKSGHPRSVMLTAPIVAGADDKVVATRAGDPAHPGGEMPPRLSPVLPLLLPLVRPMWGRPLWERPLGERL